jgi:hypothetical protein
MKTGHVNSVKKAEAGIIWRCMEHAAPVDQRRNGKIMDLYNTNERRRKKAFHLLTL